MKNKEIKKPTYIQIQKYDINQKIIHELTHLESRQILFSIIKQAKSVAEISVKTKVPISTTYLKIIILKKLSLIYIQETKIVEGKKIRYYKSRILSADISISKQEPKLILIKNNN